MLLSHTTPSWTVQTLCHLEGSEEAPWNQWIQQQAYGVCPLWDHTVEETL